MKRKGASTEGGPMHRHRQEVAVKLVRVDGGEPVLGPEREAVTAAPAGVGFIGADRELFPTTNPAGQEDCLRSVQAAEYKPWLCNGGYAP